jgi:LPXTG-motif cell wall-anchored protein
VLYLVAFLLGVSQTAEAQHWMCGKQAFCGAHCAPTCAHCGGDPTRPHPDGNLWCNGDCTYHDYPGVAKGVCHLKGTVPPKLAPAQPPAPPAPPASHPVAGSHQWMCGKQAFCGAHCARTCADCGGIIDEKHPQHPHGRLWCNGDCKYVDPTPNNGAADGHCVRKDSNLAREFDAEEATVPQGETGTSAWALPLFGVVTMFSLAVFFVVRRRREARTGQLVPERELVSEDDVEGYIE